MEPTMRAGDKLIVDTERRQLLDGIHVMVASGTLLVKRLSAGMHGTVRIISDNDRYPTQEAEISRFRWGEPDGGDAITIIGRVAYRLQAMS
ncbi:S24 family peptidase [Acetobacter sp.]